MARSQDIESTNKVLTITCHTMITLNKLAKRCLDIAVRKGKINSYTSRHAVIVAISVEWRKLLDASKYRSRHLPDYSEQEEDAAGIIISTLIYLKRIGCKNIEQLIKDKIEFNDKDE